MIDLSPPTPATCGRCGTELAAHALACPKCASLVHRERLQELAALARKATAANDRVLARTFWEQALDLVPGHSQQYDEISSRVAALADPVAGDPAPDAGGGGRWWKPGVGIGATIALLLVSKLKFLLLGLTKLSTVVSMFGFIGVYWSIYGWPLAFGIAGAIYIHEMGHVAMLRRLGIRADAPLFIPGVGALVMLRQPVTNPVDNARVGLAGPVWGLGATVAAWLLYLASGTRVWLAIAEISGFLNLFNLTPIWQLDGSRGFDVLSRFERAIVLGAIVTALVLTDVPMLWIVGAVAVYRTFWSKAGPGHTPTTLTFVGLVFALAWFARTLH